MIRLRAAISTEELFSLSRKVWFGTRRIAGGDHTDRKYADVEDLGLDRRKLVTDLSCETWHISPDGKWEIWLDAYRKRQSRRLVVRPHPEAMGD
jgi:hypothetical protein